MSEGDLRLLRDLYERGFKGGDGQLGELAERLGRTVPFLSRKAKAQGLTNRSRPTSEAVRRGIGKKARERIAMNGHPRGMAGKSHTEETKGRLREIGENRAAMGMTPAQLNPPNDETRRKMSESASERLRNGGNPYSRTKSGKRPDLDDVFFRSSWEANYARFLNLLIQQSEIERWEFEADTFWFEGIKRGSRSYTPDFKIWDKHGEIYYIEVKGWMDQKSKTKLKRMKKYHPEVDLRLVGAKEYRRIERTIGASLPGWE